MDNLVKLTNEWLAMMNSAEAPRLMANTVFHTDRLRMMGAGASGIENPANAHPTASYKAKAVSTNSSDTEPITIYDGIQTIVNMCRVKAGYNPLDPEGTGDNAHFLKFTQYISSVPILTLDWSETTIVKQKSHDASALIDSFVKCFRGLAEEDIKEVENSVTQLAKAALSYAEAKEIESNFTQNILLSETGDAVYFNLYASLITISQSEKKGTITFQTDYTLAQASYSMTKSAWERAQPSFAKQEKETLDDWITAMTTEEKEGSEVRALCLG
jgi:hypothetical protein